MLFKHPNILYALLLLLIPIIIHLVRWKKYKNVSFTNVDLLQELEIKSRKSRILKELLVLLFRLLALAALILAFARPYFPSPNEKLQKTQSNTLIYLDNSLSMNRLQNSQSILQKSVQALNVLNDEQTYTLLTNDHTYEHISGKKLKDLLYRISFSDKSTHHKDILQRIELLAGKQAVSKPDVIYISDMQNVDNEQLTKELFVAQGRYHILQQTFEKLPDISIDSLVLQHSDLSFYYLDLYLSANESDLSASVNIRQDKELLWRGTVNFTDSLRQKINLQISKNDSISAVIQLADNGFQFNNRLYFTIQQPGQIKVLHIGESVPEYLKKIYSKPEFDLIHQSVNQLNYSKLNQYNLLVFDEIKNYNQIASEAIKQYINQYGNVLVIPGKQQASAFQQFLNQLGVPTQVALDTTRVYLNKINYDAPFFKGVFLKKVTNFTYPFVNKHYKFSNSFHTLYRLSDGTPFAFYKQQKGNIFVINNSLSNDNTNFTEAASLIVPLFYQIGKTNNGAPQLYYVLGNNNQISVPVQIGKDDVLHITNKHEDFIPQQTNRFNSVLISLKDQPSKDGIYNIALNRNVLGRIALNYNRKESTFRILEFPEITNVKLVDSISDFVMDQQKQNQETGFWKNLLILAFIFLLIEMLLIKYWK